ncbi:hypothetical protein [Achromobacter sp. UMC46]|uniref:hypothetical protein n=1 Tax=Achromobacter sp. UMC46 TaxID=1862319 RepID=UPI00160496DF|nr:hypothetical protein [Achromobacter sp. UMC46]MBB1597514.1 hypothetical protein [Achromobacter sp. UMC46]
MFTFFARLARFIPAALTLAALASPVAHAAQRIVYAGTLDGAGEVVMELDAQAADNGVLTGRYFHPKAGVDIPLHGTEQALAEPPPNWKSSRGQATAGARSEAPPAAATWQGTRDAQGFRGNWTDARSGKQSGFTLRRVAEYDAKPSVPGVIRNGVLTYPDINAATAPYDTLKMAGHAEPVGEEIRHGAVAYRMWRDPRTQFPYPRLSRHPDEQVVQRVNHLLQQRHWRKSLGALQCMAQAYTSDIPNSGTLGNYDEEAIAVPWVSRALMTVTERGSLDCGGAHPFNHFEPYTYDLLRGEPLDWNRVFDAYVSGQDGRLQASPTLLAIVSATQRTLAAAEAEGHTEDSSKDGCYTLWPDYLALGAEAPGALSLSVSGVGHASGVCLGTLARVPFADLAPHVKPGGQAYLTTD